MSTATSKSHAAVLAASLAEDGLADHRPFSIIGYTAITVVLGSLGLWSAFAPLDAAAIAPARVAVEGDRKPIQHLEGGIIQDILVKEAEHVEQGQVLFRIDTTKARATAESLRKQLDAALSLEARLTAENAGLDRFAIPAPLETKAHRPHVATALADQRRILDEHRRTLELETAGLDARIRQAQEDITARESRLAGTRLQLASIAEQIGIVSGAAERGYYPRNKLREHERERARLEGEVGGISGEIARFTETIAEVRQQILQAAQRLRDDAGRDLADVRGKIAGLNEQIEVAEDALNRVEVRAPQAGIILGVKVKSPGAVIQPGATLAELVPPTTLLSLTAKVSPLDVQNVAVGQKAQIRFPAFSTRSTPPLYGRVETVSADVVSDETTKETYFSARIIVDAAGVPHEIAEKLVPGMPADVLIITGERTVLAYFLGPIRDRLAKAMRES